MLERTWQFQQMGNDISVGKKKVWWRTGEATEDMGGEAARSGLNGPLRKK